MKVRTEHRALFLAAIIMAVSSCGGRTVPLPEDNWDPAVHKAISEMISSYGKGSKGYSKDCKPYAVFDYDNTTVMNDIAVTTMAYQIETMEFTFTPETIFATLTFCIPDLDLPLLYSDPAISVTSRQLAYDLEKDYTLIYERYLKGREVPDLEGMHSSEEYLDFRAKLWGLSLGVDNTFSYDVGCVWINTLFDGMDPEQVRDIVRRNVDCSSLQEGLTKETWESPDGVMKVSVTKGLALPPESVHLYNTLRDNGFEVYICSASLEQVVEAMACDPKWGLGMDEDHVFGIRLAPTADGKIRAVGDSTYAQTYKEGKTACIRDLIAPRHCGRGPALVAGDSNGDYSMMTSFPEDLKVGLILDVPRTGDIQRLKESALSERDKVLDGTASFPIYVVQGRDDSTMRYIPSSVSRR